MRRDDQIVGLTHLLTLGLRLLTLIKTQVRRSLETEGKTLTGLYASQPKRETQQPTAKRLLQAFVRAEITLTRMEIADQVFWHLTPLSPVLEQILGSLGLSVSWYTRLIENSS